MTPDFTVTYENVVGKEATKKMETAVNKIDKKLIDDAEYLLTASLYGGMIQSDGTTRSLYPTNRSRFTYEELESAVGGGIDLVLSKNGCEMYVNNDGLPEPGREGLPLNAKATALLWKWDSSYRESQTGLHGDVLFIKTGVEGDTR